MSDKLNITALEQMAKFNLPESEKSEIYKYMEFLRADFEKLASVDTDGAKPLIYGIELNNVFRDDKVKKDIDREKLLTNAPEHENGYFKVPRTID